MKVFLAIFLALFFSACGDSNDTQQSEIKSDSPDSSKTIKPSNENIIDKDSNATIAPSSDTIKSTPPQTPATPPQNTTDSNPKPSPAPKQASAQTLYAKCAVCHGAKGDKVAPGSAGNVLIAKLSKGTIINDLKGYRAKTLKKGNSSAIMYLQAANLSDTDIESLGEYIASFNQ